MDETEPPVAAHNVRLTLHADAVAHPVHRAAKVATELVQIALKSIDDADLSEEIAPTNGFGFRITNSGMSEADTRDWYKGWLLTRGVQDLARGVREMLEEAYFYTQVISMPPGQTTWGELQGLLASLRAKANKLNFPDLLSSVNARLSEPLHFERQFLSLQAVRNCLEHRAGIVGPQDIPGNENALTLAMPRLGIFVERNGIDIELGPGSRIEKGEVISIKSVITERSFAQGESIRFDAAELVAAAYGCYAFGVDLVTKLPQRERCEVSP